MTAAYPCVYISSLDYEIIQYDWLDITYHPPLFPGMEMDILDARWVVKRVYMDMVDIGKPCIWVLVSPSNDEPFVSEEHLGQILEAYEFHNEGGSQFGLHELN